MSKHMVRVVLHVTPQTAYHLKRLANMDGGKPGRVVDKLVRDRVLMMKGTGYSGNGSKHRTESR